MRGHPIELRIFQWLRWIPERPFLIAFWGGFFLTGGTALSLCIANITKSHQARREAVVSAERVRSLDVEISSLHRESLALESQLSQLSARVPTSPDEVAQSAIMNAMKSHGVSIEGLERTSDPPGGERRPIIRLRAIGTFQAALLAITDLTRLRGDMNLHALTLSGNIPASDTVRIDLILGIEGGPVPEQSCTPSVF